MRHEALSRNVAPAGTVGRMLQLYIDGLPASGRVTPQTVGMYRAWQTHLHRVFGHLAPAGITQADVLQYLEECLRTSARGEITHLSGACQAAMRRREVTFNPCIGAKSSRPRSRRDRYLSDGELVAIRAAATPVLQVAIDLAYLTGLRVSDLSRLRWAGFAPGGHVQTAKTEARQRFTRSDDLEAVLAAARGLQERVACLCLPARKAHHRSGTAQA